MSSGIPEGSRRPWTSVDPLRPHSVATPDTNRQHDAVFAIISRFDNDRRLTQQRFLGGIDRLAASLAESASDSLVRIQNRRERSRPLDRQTEVVEFGSHLDEFQGVVPRCGVTTLKSPVGLVFGGTLSGYEVAGRAEGYPLRVAFSCP